MLATFKKIAKQNFIWGEGLGPKEGGINLFFASDDLMVKQKNIWGRLGAQSGGGQKFIFLFCLKRLNAAKNRR